MDGQAFKNHMIALLVEALFINSSQIPAAEFFNSLLRIDNSASLTGFIRLAYQFSFICSSGWYICSTFS